MDCIQKRIHSNTRVTGFTLVELLVVISILVILMGASATIYLTTAGSNKSTIAVDDIKSMLQRAKFIAITERRTCTLEFIDETTLAVMRVPKQDETFTYSETDPDCVVESMTLPNAVKVDFAESNIQDGWVSGDTDTHPDLAMGADGGLRDYINENKIVVINESVNPPAVINLKIIKLTGVISVEHVRSN